MSELSQEVSYLPPREIIPSAIEGEVARDAQQESSKKIINLDPAQALQRADRERLAKIEHQPTARDLIAQRSLNLYATRRHEAA